MKKLDVKQMVRGGNPWWWRACAGFWFAALGASNTIEERYFFDEYAYYCVV